MELEKLYDFKASNSLLSHSSLVMEEQFKDFTFSQTISEVVFMNIWQMWWKQMLIAKMPYFILISNSLFWEV